MQVLQSKTVRNELGRQPIQQLGMTRSPSVETKVHGRNNDRTWLVAEIHRLDVLVRLQLAGTDHVGELDPARTEGVEPLIFMTDEENVFRKDEAHTDITQADALKNAPSKDSDYFKVPKVLSKGQDQA